MDLIEKIGPVLGIAAFFGLAVLAFLLFQQGREVRRLREWAGRAPERAQDAAEASLAAAEARGEARAPAPERGRVGRTWQRVFGPVGRGVRALDRRLPIDWRYLPAALLVVVVAAGVLTSGFGLVGGGDEGAAGDAHRAKPKVAVLNATASGSTTPVAGLAHKVSNGVVEPAGYKVVTEDNSPTPLTNTTVMYAPGFKAAANRFAKKVRPKLGETAVQPMTSAVRGAAKNARIALLVGLDDSTVGQ